MSAYRTPAVVPLDEPDDGDAPEAVHMGPMDGLLRLRGRHVCAPPGWWSRLWNRVADRDLWRCGECNKVWKYDGKLYDRWQHTGIHEWVEAGGDPWPEECVK